ncbi:hypothetical protein ACFQW6_02790 [Nocardioides sp. GCM10028917]|uniref:hypothetical protein n=1 Tax=Nocardioides sp. GCM10028917 TaxID=3273408 RepID=UPI00360EECD1
MTTRDLIRAMLQRWYVMVLGAVISLGFVYVSTHQPTVYWTQFNVVLLGPTDPEFPNYLEDPHLTLHPMVGLVADHVNGGARSMMTASTDTSMVGQGIQSGIQVRVPNLGSQHRGDFSANYLDIQVAGPTPEGVTADARIAVEMVEASLDSMQDDLGIEPRSRIRSIASTSDATIYPVRGNRVRAAAASGVSGAAMTVVLVCWLERRRNRRVSAPA